MLIRHAALGRNCFPGDRQVWSRWKLLCRGQATTLPWLDVHLSAVSGRVLAAVLPEFSHPFEDLVCKMNGPFGLFVLTG